LRDKLGPGKIYFVHNKAPCYMDVVSGGDLCGFDELEVAAGKAPDMSHLDATICPFMERGVKKAGATTTNEIRKAVKRAWAKVTPAMCEKVSKKVCENMAQVIAKNGGNFYSE